MRNAETVLGLIRDRGGRGLPLERVYRLLSNRNLYLLAYGKLARNRGAMTPGATPETVDGMALAKIDAIIAALRNGRYRWTPVRRTSIPKANGKRRPLGLPICLAYCTSCQYAFGMSARAGPVVPSPPVYSGCIRSVDDEVSAGGLAYGTLQWSPG